MAKIRERYGDFLWKCQGIPTNFFLLEKCETIIREHLSSLLNGLDFVAEMVGVITLAYSTLTLISRFDTLGLLPVPQNEKLKRERERDFSNHPRNNGPMNI